MLSKSLSKFGYQQHSFFQWDTKNHIKIKLNIWKNSNLTAEDRGAFSKWK